MHRSRIAFVSLLLLVACQGGSTATSGEADTSAGIMTIGDATDTASSTTQVADTSGTGDASSSGGDEVCNTVLCGEPASCCAADEDCAAGACLPACDTGVRCGADSSICCAGGQVCVSDACVTPTGRCIDSFDCEIGEFCEPTLGQCLPQFDPVTCAYDPNFEDIEVTLEWSYTDEQSISSPMIADLDADGVPEVVVITTVDEGGGYEAGDLVVLDGATGLPKWRVDHGVANAVGPHGRSTVGIADIDGDDAPDIVFAGRPAGGGSVIQAYDGIGNLLWASHDAGGTSHGFNVVNGAPSFGNFDDDAGAEVVFGAAVIDNDGLVVWDQGGDGAAFGTNGGYTGGISAIVDLTADGFAEIVSGRHAWTVSWQPGPIVTLAPLWDAGAPDGYPAIADLDLDGDPEVVLVANGTVRVLDGGSGEAWCGVDPTGAACIVDDTLRTSAIAIPGGGIGGPPTIADFDGDGRPEIAAAGGSSYSVYDLAREGEALVVPMGDPVPADGSIYVRWSQATQDQSSNATGSSVFDFQGDGTAEVVYADECYVRVYSGVDGTVLVEEPNSSATIHEYPLVVDVDGDGNSEIVVVANDDANSCGAIDGYVPRHGVFVYGDAFDRWVQTRRVWTSHTYHVSNATSAGNYPAAEIDNWTQPGLNNYRQNVQGAGVFNAPDLSVDLAIGVGGCLAMQLQIIATVRNIGALGVPAGVPVTLHEGTDATGMAIGTMLTPEALLPGASVELVWDVDAPPNGAAASFFVVVDGAMNEVVVECDEENNTAATQSAACPIPG